MPQTIVPVKPEPLQKVKYECTSDKGHLIHIEYNGGQDAFRIRCGATQRLFFFETQLFQKTLFLNEYGIVSGELVLTKLNSGWMRLEGKRYRFGLEGNEAELHLYEGRSKDPALSCSIDTDLLSQHLDSRHRLFFIQCLVFAFAWALT